MEDMRNVKAYEGKLFFESRVQDNVDCVDDEIFFSDNFVVEFIFKKDDKYLNKDEFDEYLENNYDTNIYDNIDVLRILEGDNKIKFWQGVKYDPSDIKTTQI